MSAYLYLAALIGSGFCMGLLDYRWKLFLFDRPKAALAAVAVGFCVFLSWDLIAIDLGAYIKGASDAMTGFEIGPELPIEELFFITFLCYITGVIHGGMKLLDRVRRQSGAR